ncbi:MAG: TIGR04100 family radical SAM protein [Lachnospiraceae bacterium]|nr:TIGR04100 family radical SAM protein [Lachnospiraceae bacterium]
MADILYTYKNQVYANITNRCDCSCVFCIRSHQDGVGESENLWHEKDPDLEEIKKAMDEFNFTEYGELVYCGYGEPTCAIETLIASAAYAKERYGIKVRLNTNGLANLYHGRDVVPELAQVVDSVSISLNAPTAEKYQQVTRPAFENAFSGMLAFATLAKDAFGQTQFTAVDVLSPEELKACQELADEMGIRLRIRKFT